MGRGCRAGCRIHIRARELMCRISYFPLPVASRAATAERRGSKGSKGRKGIKGGEPQKSGIKGWTGDGDFGVWQRTSTASPAARLQWHHRDPRTCPVMAASPNPICGFPKSPSCEPATPHTPSPLIHPLVGPKPPAGSHFAPQPRNNPISFQLPIQEPPAPPVIGI